MSTLVFSLAGISHGPPPMQARKLFRGARRATLRKLKAALTQAVAMDSREAARIVTTGLTGVFYAHDNTGPLNTAVTTLMNRLQVCLTAQET